MNLQTLTTTQTVSTSQATDPKRKLHFLDLPLEIRIEIYKLCLLWHDCVFSGYRDFVCAGYDFHGKVDCPGVLQVCRAISIHAIPLLYEINNFQFVTPDRSFEWLQVIGPKNTAHLRRLGLLVDLMVTTPSKKAWYDVLEKLATEATGLRFIDLYFDRWGYNQGHQGLGDDAHFFKLLAGLKTVETVVLKGFYLQSWQDYLKEHMGTGTTTVVAK